MKYRELGASRIQVSEIGFGGWGIGGISKGGTSYGPTDDGESERAIEKAFDLGVNFFDTAPIYGHSETLIGKTFKGRRDQVVIATKVGFLENHRSQDFSNTNLVSSLHRSLRNLQTDYIDLYQLHNPSIRKLPMDEIIGTLNELRLKGLIRIYGVSIKSPDDGPAAIKFGAFSSLQTNLNMIDHRAIESGLLVQAKEQGVGLIARTPFCFGFLTGKITDFNFDPNDHRSKWSTEQLKTWQRAAKLLAKVNPCSNSTLAQVALRFCIDTEGISTVIPGMIKVSDVLENVAATNLPHLSQETIQMIQKIYKDNDQFFIRQPSLCP